MEAPTQAGVYVIRAPEEVEALRSPVRQQIVELLEEHPDSSVAELAGWIGMPAESLYFHLQPLRAVGLVLESGRRPAGRRYESLYALRSRSLELDPNQRSARFLDALRGLYETALRAAARRLSRALEAEKHESGPRRLTALRRRTVRLSTRDERRLRRRLLELDAFLARHDDPEESRVLDVATVLSVRPAAEPKRARRRP